MAERLRPAEPRGPALEFCKQLIDDRTIQPPVDPTFTLEHAPEAHAYLSDRRNVGKVVLVPAR